MVKYRAGLFFLCFYIIWMFKEWVFTRVEDPAWALIAVKLAVWLLPVYLYLKFVDRLKNPLAFLGLNKNAGKGVLWGMTLGLILASIELALAFVFHGHLDWYLGWRWVTTLIYAFPEEVMFRGFILKKLSQSLNFIKSNVYASLLFVSIHFPVWFLQEMTLPKFIFNVVTVFIVGFGLGYLYKKTQSLWSTTIVHTIYNLLIYIRT